ncbi:MAG: GntR family transcriptional regulator [Acidobacteria bacterium]|nr:GntR family transcriptional regulator [Acidobacteriota bacterium]MCI0626768.1 GntR family transcriptional regulator [Acidobacteriota bacterium]MCI0720048.1 GntR family transcriptional regulator [Acidobacteriota bacterium]
MSRTKNRLKKDEIAFRLREKLGKVYPVGTFLPPERALAEAFGVARPTLRRALEPLIKEGLLENCPGVGTRVVAARALARRLKSKWRVIGLLLPDIRSPFFVEITEAIEYTALQRGYQILLCSSRRQLPVEELHIKQLVERQVDGVIIAHDRYREFPQTLDLLEKASIPFVLMFGIPTKAKFDTVAVDEKAGVYEAMRYLLSLGHREIAFCHPLPQTEPHPRMEAYLEFMKENRLPVPKHFFIPSEALEDRAAPFTLKNLLSRSPHPTALFAGNDQMAIILLKQLAALKMRVPEDFSVMGFDNLRFAEHLSVPLTTMDQPIQEMGRRATELLLERVELAKPLAPRHEIFHPRLIIRESCAVVRSESSALARN